MCKETFTAMCGTKELKYTADGELVSIDSLFGCRGFKLPEYITSIGCGLFINGEIIIHSGVRLIGSDAFDERAKVTISEKNPYYYMEGNCLIQRDRKMLVQAFRDFSIPCDVKVLGKNCFPHRYSDEIFVIPEHIVELEEQVFFELSYSKIAVHSGVMKIGSGAFAGAETIILDSDNPYYSMIDGCLIENETKRLMWCKSGVIPQDERVISIAPLAFAKADFDLNNPFLAGWHVPKNMEIKAGAFAFFGGLVEYGLTMNGTIIKKYEIGAFEGCENLRKVYVSKGTNIISVRCFADCRKLSLVDFEDNSKVEIIADEAFWGCSTLESITFPESLKEIRDFAFDFTKIKQVVLPRGIRYIGARAFPGTIRKIIYMGTPDEWDKVKKVKGDIGILKDFWDSVEVFFCV